VCIKCRRKKKRKDQTQEENKTKQTCTDKIQVNE